MSSIKTLIVDFMKEEEGLSVVEYVLGGALVVSALIAADPWAELGAAVENVISDAEAASSKSATP
ncbi:Flp family type IVb pilin [Vibrio mediterranei]|uniref:Flp family type IVb pilin n=1 Tax=Vibrio mediterranei TaxID=689 RepID=UPI0040695BBE